MILYYVTYTVFSHYIKFNNFWNYYFSDGLNLENIVIDFGKGNLSTLKYYRRQAKINVFTSLGYIILTIIIPTTSIFNLQSSTKPIKITYPSTAIYKKHRESPYIPYIYFILF
jgi:hypothetical protein